MKPITVSRTIQAPIDRVFAAISDVRNFSQAVPAIQKVELLTDQQIGAGTRFRETRVMKGKEVAAELEIAEHVENERVRMVSDMHGTVWDTLFTVERIDENETQLAMVMDAHAKKLSARMMNAMIRGMIAKFVEQDMDAVKTFCETGDGP